MTPLFPQLISPTSIPEPPFDVILPSIDIALYIIFYIYSSIYTYNSALIPPIETQLEVIGEISVPHLIFPLIVTGPPTPPFTDIAPSGNPVTEPT